jgi:hypothetical protein
MKKITLVLSLLIATFTATIAQVKIGNNPNTIDPNSLLEMESTSKGFLPPRVALNSAASVSPLTGTVPEGMLVYSNGGSLSNGYYYWNGTKWAAVNSGASRNNFVIVKSEADFPTPSGGVIMLDATKFYQINGTVYVSNKINLNGCALEGMDATNDKLIYLGSGELFTGSGGGNIKSVTLAAPSGKVFNLNAGGAVKNLIIQSGFIASSSEVGVIQGFGGTVYLGTIAFQSNTNGVTYQNNTNVVLFNTLWDNTNHGYYEKFTGSFSIIQLLGGVRLTNSAYSAVALHISGITSVGNASVKTVMFTGTGTYVSGSFSNSWEVESSGLNTEKDDVAGANLYMSTTAVTDIITQDVPVKIAGTTTAPTLFRMSMPANNRLTYLGSKTRRFMVICSLTATAAQSGKHYTFHFFKNGVKLPESSQSMKMASATSDGSITLSCNVQLAPNDYIEVYVENDIDNSDVTINDLNLSMR